MQSNTTKPRVGISSCLMGQAVRYDGAHKYSSLCVDELSALFDFVPTCPELGAGLGVPRPPIRLVGDPAAPHAVRVDDPRIDVTNALHAYAAQRVPQLRELCGYIFIQNSPSCGLVDVKVYDVTGALQSERGHGLFAAALTRAYPLLPVAEEGQLHDPESREHFVTQVLAAHDWRRSCAGGINAAGLIDFHSRYKYTLMAHGPGDYAGLGRLLADVGRNDDLAALAARYYIALMQHLQRPATRRTHANVLMHLQGYLKADLNEQEKQTMTDTIAAYRRGDIPRAVPLQLLRAQFEHHPNAYIARQIYLQPQPGEAIS